jgi:dolichol-phosphate mannosyltransferase
MFAVRADVVKAVRDQLRPTGYKILLELLARCPLDSIEERGYTFRRRAAGGSNLGAGEYIDYVRHLARLSIPSRRAVNTEVGDVAAD